MGDAAGTKNRSNHADIEPLAEAGVPGFKCFLLYPGCDGLQSIDEPSLRLALLHIARCGLPLLVHAELAGPCQTAARALDTAGADWRRYATYLASRPDQAEVNAVQQMIGLCREFGARVHIVHVSSAEVLPLLRRARAEGLPLTAETCPHYLLFAAEEIAEGATDFKCAPPIRSAANRSLLWEALLDGTLDLIATDHSPCPPAMKHLPSLGGDGDFRSAWGGIAGISLGLSAAWTGWKQYRDSKEQYCDDQGQAGDSTDLCLSHMARWMAEAPARLCGLADRKGRIAEGMDADLVVFDPDCAWTVAAADLHFRHPVSPYVGRVLRGRVERTILRGQTVFSQGTFPAAALGREVRAGV